MSWPPNQGGIHTPSAVGIGFRMHYVPDRDKPVSKDEGMIEKKNTIIWVHDNLYAKWYQETEIALNCVNCKITLPCFHKAVYFSQKKGEKKLTAVKWPPLRDLVIIQYYI